MDACRLDELGELGVLGEEPKARMEGVGAAARAAATTATGSSRSRPRGPSVTGMTPDTEPIAGPDDPSGHLAAIRDEDVRIEWGALAPRYARVRRRERVNRVNSDTPSPTDTTRREPPVAIQRWTDAATPEPPGELAEGSAHLASCRQCRTCPNEAPAHSSAIRRRGRP